MFCKGDKVKAVTPDPMWAVALYNQFMKCLDSNMYDASAFGMFGAPKDLDSGKMCVSTIDEMEERTGKRADSYLMAAGFLTAWASEMTRAAQELMPLDE